MHGLGNTQEYTATDLRRRDRVDRLYGGELLHIATTPTSSLVAARVREDLASLLPEGTDPRDADSGLGVPAFVKHVHRYQRRIRSWPEWRTWIPAMVEEAGLPTETLRFDAPNLRVVLARPDDEKYSAAVCLPHRDTWSGHHQAQVNCWLAVYDTPWEASFAFYPALFSRPVPNNSEQVDYSERRLLDIMGRVTETERPSPRANGGFDRSSEERLPTSAGDLLLFSAAHLHETRPNTSGRTRFSLDFRTVLQWDAQQGKGSINVDNRSKGSTLIDMLSSEDQHP